MAIKSPTQPVTRSSGTAQKDESNFPPPRRPGLILLGAAMLIFAGGASLAFFVTFNATTSANILVSIAVGLVMFAPLPLLAYQGFALLAASYSLERDGLRIRWGLRSEDIPLPEIEWIRPASELVTHLALPWPRWTGAILGTRHAEGLGPVEFLASDARTLLLVATSMRIFAISPANPHAFMRAFRDANELGSLNPLRPQSANPQLLVGSLWADLTGRILVVSSLILSLLLLAWVGLIIPARASLSLGFTPDGLSSPPGPSARLLLLPVLNGAYVLVDILSGLFYYRRSTLKRPDNLRLTAQISAVQSRSYRTMAYILWGSAVLTALIIIIGVFEILR